MPELKAVKTLQIGLAGCIRVFSAGGLVAVTLILTILHYKPQGLGGSNPSPPIKVRGGSMTAYTSDDTVSTGWQNIGLNVYCSIVDDITYIAKDNKQLVDAKGKTLTITYPWEIDIYGNSPPTTPTTGKKYANSLGTNGISLKGAKTDCAKMPDNNGNEGSVTLSLIGQNVGFYPNDLPNAGVYLGNKRFWDYSLNCRGEPDVVTYTGAGDRDYCERMNTVKVSFMPTAANPVPIPPQTLPCPDGDCEVDIGTP